MIFYKEGIRILNRNKKYFKLVFVIKFLNPITFWKCISNACTCVDLKKLLTCNIYCLYFSSMRLLQKKQGDNIKRTEFFKYKLICTCKL